MPLLADNRRGGGGWGSKGGPRDEDPRQPTYRGLVQPNEQFQSVKRHPIKTQSHNRGSFKMAGPQTKNQRAPLVIMEPLELAGAPDQELILEPLEPDLNWSN